MRPRRCVGNGGAKNVQFFVTCLHYLFRLDDKIAFLFSCTQSDPAVHALQFLDVINMKDPGQKSQFYRTTLKDILPSIPKVRNNYWFNKDAISLIVLLAVIDTIAIHWSCLFFIFSKQKLWFQHVWPSLQQELRTQEVLAAALQPILLMIQEISPDEYQLHIMPTIRLLF